MALLSSALLKMESGMRWLVRGLAEYTRFPPLLLQLVTMA